MTVPAAPSSPTTPSLTPTPQALAVLGISGLRGPRLVRRACLKKRCKPPVFTFTAEAPETVVLRFNGARGRRERSVIVVVTAAGKQRVKLTRKQRRRLRHGRTRLVAAVGTSGVTFRFRVK